MEVLMNYGVRLSAPMFDTMIAHYVLQPEQKHNMDILAETLLNYQTVHIDELIGPKGKGQKSMRDLSPASVCDYAAEDADVTLRLYNVLKPRLKEAGVEQLFYDIEMPLVPVLADMGDHGRPSGHRSPCRNVQGAHQTHEADRAKHLRTRRT